MYAFWVARFVASWVCREDISTRDFRADLRGGDQLYVGQRKGVNKFLPDSIQSIFIMLHQASILLLKKLKLFFNKETLYSSAPRLLTRHSAPPEGWTQEGWLQAGPYDSAVENRTELCTGYSSFFSICCWSRISCCPLCNSLAFANRDFSSHSTPSLWTLSVLSLSSSLPFPPSRHERYCRTLKCSASGAALLPFVLWLSRCFLAEKWWSKVPE